MSSVTSLSTTSIWLHVVVFAIATYLLQVSAIGVFEYFDIPSSVEEELELVPPAVLAAMILPPLVYREGSFHLSPTNPFLLAGVVAALVAWRTGNLVATILGGFVAFFAVSTLSMW